MENFEVFFDCPILREAALKGWRFDFNRRDFVDMDIEVSPEGGGDYHCPVIGNLVQKNTKFDFVRSEFIETRKQAPLGAPYFYLKEKNGSMCVQQAIEKDDRVSNERYKSGNYYLCQFSAMERADRINELLKDR